MPTILQLSRKSRLKRRRRCKVPALLGSPQKRAVIYQIAITSPRKPNSAKRRFAKVRILSNMKKKAFAKIPGIGPHYLNEHNVVLLEGGSPTDTPGVNYTLMRGFLDFDRPELYGRKRKRSKYGLKKEEENEF
jgi:small subunit ribosomal protein S12